jgi:hypothetical protein
MKPPPCSSASVPPSPPATVATRKTGPTKPAARRVGTPSSPECSRTNHSSASFVHFHVLVPNGVFTRTEGDGSVVFREGPAPTRAEIASVAARVEKRMRRSLRRRGLLDERAEEDLSNEAPELSPLEACMQLSLFGSTYVRLGGDGAAVPLAGEEARFRAAGKGPWVADASGRIGRGLFRRFRQIACDRLSPPPRARAPRDATCEGANLS